MDAILLVEDDRFFREMYSKLLINEGYQVDCAACGSDGLQMLANGQYSLVITDLVMPDINGLEILSRVRDSFPAVDVIMVTGNANLESAVFALKHGARDYLIKPINPDELKHSVAQCIQQRHLIDENEDLKNMLSLFRASQALAGCLDRDHLYLLLVEALVRETGFNHALAYYGGDGSLTLKVSKDVSDAAGRHIADLVNSFSAADGDGWAIERISLGIDGFTEAYLIPVGSWHAKRGVIVLLNSSDSVVPEIAANNKNIHFLVEQSLRSLENAETYSKATDMLFIDDVSGLYNHRYLDVALEREMKRVERYASQLAVLFIDVDSFKSVNDQYGHLVGSRVLAEFGSLIKKSVREVDIVIRYGGDEYTVILVETTCATAQLVAERIRHQVEEHHFSGPAEEIIRLTCSIGFACCPDDTASKDMLLEMADRAMYAGKTTGKNQVLRISAA